MPPNAMKTLIDSATFSKVDGKWMLEEGVGGLGTMAAYSKFANELGKQPASVVTLAKGPCLFSALESPARRD
jgi:hypothetical protein